MSELLFPALAAGRDEEALRFGGEAITYAELARAAGGLATRLDGATRAAVLATPTLDTCVAVVGTLAAGAAVVPINPASTDPEIEHVLGDSEPEVVIASDDQSLPQMLATRPRVTPRGSSGAYSEAAAGNSECTAMIIYTSGTTGLPKGVQIPHRAIATNLDALFHTWAWTPDDRLAHALPLFHVHGLVLGTLGPLRLGGRVQHVGRFSPDAVAAALRDNATMMFGVPTMYHRLGDAAEQDGSVADALAGARLLVSGSAALPAVEHQRLERLTGQKIVERYGMTETLMNTAVRADGERRPGYVGLPVPGVDLRLLGDDGREVDPGDETTIGEIAVRGPNLFTGYLNRPDATVEAMRDGWFFTGDLATRALDGYVRIVGRRSTDLIKSAGYKIGAGEVEGALLEHEAVAEVAVKGVPDDDLGERVVAWVVVSSGSGPSADELMAHTAVLLAHHKCPREIRFVEELPRNAMGKVIKKELA
jgi:malonyl-CoA/methylmalonyl-CoA synthetase